MKLFLKYSAIFLGFCAVIFLCGMYIIQTHSYEIESEKLPQAFDGYKIVFLSDLHSAKFAKYCSAIINKLNPDVILCGGDMINSYSDGEDEAFLSMLKLLGGRYPVYWVNGNHEQIAEHTAKWYNDYIKEIADAGAVFLEDETIAIKKGGERIFLSGLDIHLMYYKNPKDPEMSRYEYTLSSMEGSLGKAPSGFSVLLTHNPVYFPVYAMWGADLTLCGHMHGGVIRLPFVGGLYSPEITMFPEYDKGLFALGKKKMIVSAGLGNGTSKIRVFNPPEVVLVTLKRK